MAPDSGKRKSTFDLGLLERWPGDNAEVPSFPFILVEADLRLEIETEYKPEGA